MADGNWSAAEAKAKFSELMDRATREGPQHVSRNGRETVVVISAEEWRRRTRQPKTVLEFLERSPLKGAKIDLERRPDFGRDVDLG